jgi:uncharacterized membrane protein
MTAELLILRLIHVLGAIFWVGSALFNTIFLLPALATVGPAAGQIMGGLQRRRLFDILPIVGILTVLSGLRLMWITSTGFSDAYVASASGRTFMYSGGAAIVAVIIGLGFARPAAGRAARLGASLASAPEHERGALGAELARLRRRAGITSNIATALIVLAAAGMSVARYLG